LIDVLAHGQPFALAHHVADVAENEQIARNRAGQAGHVISLAGHEASGKAPRRADRGIFIGHRGIDALGHCGRQLDTLGLRQIGEAFCQIRVVGFECLRDALPDHGFVVSQGRIHPKIRQLRRIVLRPQ
jgi:hypothetical protein